MMKKILASVVTLVMGISVFAFGVSNLSHAAEKTTQDITVEKALEIAIKESGYSQKSIKYTKAWEDKNELGVKFYKVVVDVGMVEYGYQIDKAGTVLKCDIKD